jgi:geranylgeranyl diphosphate synthase, type II
MKYTVPQLQEVFSEALENRLRILPQTPTGLYEPVTYTLGNSGKRLRPVFVLAACNMFTINIGQALPAAIAIEIFHNFTLLHDDIMDKAPLRRNKQTVHVKWDENTAILSGDAMTILAYQALTATPADKLQKVMNEFNKMAIEVCEGQQMDMNFEKMQNVKDTEYLQMIELKTSVLIASSMKIGAIIGNASTDDANLIYDFGKNLGLAFQLQDDLLDVFGDEASFGKTIGGDILANKKTYLLIKALEQAEPEQYKNLQYWLNAKDYEPEEKIYAVTKIYNQLNIKQITEKKINEHHNLSLNSLNKVSVPDERKGELRKIADELIFRKK